LQPFDLDSVPIPAGYEGQLVSEAMVRAAVREIFPQQFHDATLIWQFSASQGIKAGLRLRLWFWFDRAVTCQQMKAWVYSLAGAKDSVGGRSTLGPPKAPLDTVMYRPAQPIYTADPQFKDGAANPVLYGDRMGLSRGVTEQVPFLMGPYTVTVPEPGQRMRGENTVAEQDDPVFQWLSREGMIDSAKGDGWYRMAECPWGIEHENGDPSGADYRVSGGFHCHHNSHAHLGPKDLYRYVTEHAGFDAAAAVARLNSRSASPLRLKVDGQWWQWKPGGEGMERVPACEAVTEGKPFEAVKGTLELEVSLLSGEKLSSSSVDRCLADISTGGFSEAQKAELRALVVRHSHLNVGDVNRALRQHRHDGDVDQEPTHHDVALQYLDALEGETGVRPVAAEGNVFRCVQGVWQPLSAENIARDVPAMFSGLRCLQKGGDYTSIAKHVYRTAEDVTFFQDAPLGVVTGGHFLRLQPDGRVTCEILTPAHRQRFVLPYAPDYSTPVQWFEFLDTTFAGYEQAEQIALLQEIFGAVLFGLMPSHQQAVLLFGEPNAGKSLVHHVMSSMVPACFRISVSPYRWDNATHLARLAGARLNLVGELEPDKGMPAGAFKTVTGGDTIEGKKLYQQPFDFSNTAAHVFNSNFFPPCKDRTDAFFRRWLILDFANAVSESNRVLDLGNKIVEEEGPHVLGWAIQGAQRLVVSGFTETESHKRLKARWRRENSNVASFLMDSSVVVVGEGQQTSYSDMAKVYRWWCGENGYKALGRNKFLDEARTVLAREFGARGVRLEDNNYFVGVGLRATVLATP
jgi:putative DNA primase/helicase